MKPVVLFVALWLTSVFSVAQTLEQFLSHPIESNLVSSTDGKNIAWVVNDHGKRNVMIKIGNDLPKLFTDYQIDDGQEISHLTFSPNGLKLIYVRGGNANRFGESPNPASLAEGAEQAIYFKDISSKYSPTRITAGSNPVFFKDGLKILFAKGGQIYETGLEVNASPKPLFSARGGNYNPQFSPNGNEVLFSSDRGDHSFVGVFSMINKTIRWISPDVSSDVSPVWSPDGKRIAFIRMPGVRAGQLENLTIGMKFSVMVADAETGKANVIWKSPGMDGGFSQNTPQPLAWTSTDRILFFSEHSGWNHVYSMNSVGGELIDITPGDGEVESYTLDVQHKNIYFDGNREDIDRRHIWKSDIFKGNPISITQGDGIEMYPLVSGAALYCFSSTVNTSKRLVKISEAAKTFEAVNPQKWPAFSSASFVKPESVLLKAADGTTIHAQLFINRSVNGKRPGVVFMHGGPIRQMLLGFHYNDYYINCYAFNQYLASQGYIVLSVNYRSGIGYGRDFRLAKNQGPRGASEYQDVIASGKYLQTLAEVEPAKVGLWGGSYGGYLTAMGLSRNPELFKAGVDLHGVHDWAFRAREFVPRGGWWGIQDAELDLAYKNSPSSDLSKWIAPVLMVHGDDDRNVQFQETVDLTEKLRDKNVPVEVLILPDEVHGFLRYDTWRRVFETAKDFLDRNLKK